MVGAAHHSLNILFADGVVDAQNGRSRFGKDIQHSGNLVHSQPFGDLVHPQARHPGKIFAAFGYRSDLHARTAAAFVQDFRRLFVNLLIGFLIGQTRFKRIDAAGIGPAGNGCLEARAARIPRVLVEADVVAFPLQLLHAFENFGHLAPVFRSEGFQMGNLHPHAALLHHADHLFEGFQQQIHFVSRMDHDDSVVLGDRLADLNHLLGGGIAAGRIDKAERHAARALFHPRFDQLAHFADLIPGRGPVLASHDVHSDGAGAEQADKATGRICLFRQLHVFPMAAPPEIPFCFAAQTDHILGQLGGVRIVDRSDRQTVLPDQLGRDSLPDDLKHPGIIKGLQLGMAVAVDKAGRQNLSASINHCAVLLMEEAPDLLDQTAADQNIPEKGSASRAVIYGCVSDQCSLPHRDQASCIWIK